jgi:multidrug efflux pump subunit AcrB
MALTGVVVVYMPKGFFPIQDNGVINGASEGAQDISPDAMKRLHLELGEVILRDPDVAAFSSKTAGGGGAKTTNSGNFAIVLKPREQREFSASQIIDRLRPQLAKVAGGSLNLQPAQDITVGGRVAKSGFQFTLQDTNVAELGEWSKKLLDEMRRLPELVDVSTDLMASAPQLKITINRDQPSAFFGGRIRLRRGVHRIYENAVMKNRRTLCACAPKSYDLPHAHAPRIDRRNSWIAANQKSTSQLPTFHEVGYQFRNLCH